MSKEVATQPKQLPAFLKAFAPVDPGAQDKWSSGTKSGFPVISTKGKVFHVRRGEEVELVTSPSDPDEPASSISGVVLDTHPGTAKTFYKGKYVEGSDDKPTCYSNDGVHPALDAAERQFKNCALCPRNQWGSRITEGGTKAKECSDVKRLAFAMLGTLNDPMLIRVPPTSLKTWDTYVEMLRKRGYLPEHMITKISFDHTVAHQSLLFKPVNFITEAMIPELMEAREGGTIKSIIGGDAPSGALPPPDMADDEVVDTKTGEITKKAADDDELDFDDDDDSDAEAAAAAKAAEAAAAKKKAAAAKKKKAAAEAAAAAAAVEDEDVEEDAADEAVDDLDFDDLDFDD